ncbi:globin-like [Physella acuta]|uniref:globin-like n=1 Tax=Physella acuta TaxID=109671 RepID=UPI0027DB2DAF|nr:globin-like [Physella acuta]
MAEQDDEEGETKDTAPLLDLDPAEQEPVVEEPPKEETFSQYDDVDKCAVSGLTEREKMKMVRSWKKIIGETPQAFKQAGISLVLWMFDNVQGMRERFSYKFNPSATESNLINDDKFLAHTTVIIMSFESFISTINKPAELDKRFHSIAVSHLNMKPSIGSNFFDCFEKNFHLYLTRALKVAADDEDIKIWMTFISQFCKVVRQEEAGMTKKKPSTGCCFGLLGRSRK